MTAHRITGDWMINGQIDNLGRQRRLDVEVIDGKLRLPNEYPDYGAPATVTQDGDLQAWGASVTFCPDGGELARIGVAAA